MRTKKRSAAVVAAAIAIAAFLSGTGAASATPTRFTSQVVPPWQSYEGRSYSQWSAAQWKWELEAQNVPNSPMVEQNPGTATDPQHVDCTLGQRGNVWFLAGVTFYQPDVPVYRACQVRAGVALFFPLVDSWIDNLSCPGQAYTTLTRQQLAAAIAPLQQEIVPGSMSVAVDGQSLKGLADGDTPFWKTSVGWHYVLPANNALSQLCAPGAPFPAGTRTPPPGAAAAGVYVMLRPMAPGVHQISFTAKAAFSSGTFTEDVHYTVDVDRHH